MNKLNTDFTNETKDLNIFEDLKTVLEYYQKMGYDSLPVSLQNNPETIFIKDKSLLLKSLIDEIGSCTKCKLSRQRKNIVFGEGSPNANIMFIGEGPGREEDIQGLPFVGEAGMLLTRLIEKMGLKRSNVYIANIVKCRPPMNRDPESDEIETCRVFIERQIEIIKPKVIITLGRIALQSIMHNPDLKITSVRGNFFEYNGIPVMPTFHPAYLLRNPKDKWLTWTDAQKVMERIKVSEH